jgi:hypothetical protein
MIREGDWNMLFAAGGYYLPDYTSVLSFLSTYMLDYMVYGQVSYSVLSADISPWLSGSVNVVGGLGHHGYIPVTNVYNETTMNYVYTPQAYVADVMGSIGIGVEVVLFTHFCTSFMFGYAPTYSITTAKFSLPAVVSVSYHFRY